VVRGRQQPALRRRDGIWLLPRISGRPVRIATPLFQPGNWPAYYGHVGWTAQFTWWPG